jgi:hypothetical protein
MISTAFLGGADRSRRTSPCATSLLAPFIAQIAKIPARLNGNSILVGVADEHRNMLKSR